MSAFPQVIDLTQYISKSQDDFFNRYIEIESKIYMENKGTWLATIIWNRTTFEETQNPILRIFKNKGTD